VTGRQAASAGDEPSEPALAPADDATPGRPRGRDHLLPLLAIAAIGLAGYANAYSAAFVYDDVRLIRNNPLIRDLGNFLSTWTAYHTVPNRYVAYLSLALNYRLGGLAPAGYHAVNVGVHVLNALLVHALVVLSFRTPRLSRSSLAAHARPIAFIASALFVAHPIQTQAVTYVVQRMTSLATFFYLAAVVLYAAWRLNPPGRSAVRSAASYLAVILASVLAMRTKEIAFTLPFAITLLELSFFEPTRRRWAFLLPILATALIIPLSLLDARQPIAQVLSAAAAATRVQTQLGRLEYLTTQLAVVVTYLFLLLFPIGQNLDHDYPGHRSFLEPEVLSSLGVLLALAGFAVLLYRGTARGARRPLDPGLRLAGFGIGWWFLAHAVESSVIPIVDIIYEHRVYLPSVGFFAAVAVGIFLLARRFAAPGAAARTAVIAGTALALLLAAATHHRNRVWASEISVWADAASKSPDKARPSLNLGTALIEAGRFREAESPIRRAASLDPGSSWPHVQLAGVLLRLGRAAEAEPELREALRIAPNDPEALFNLAMLLWSSRRAEESRPLFRRFLQVAPPSYSAARQIASKRAGD
jgi:tetratricopeptide (TPR) repeat protein